MRESGKDNRRHEDAVGIPAESRRLTFPKRFRPIVEALEVQGLRDEITAGANLSADEALERVVQLASPPHDLIGRQGDVGGGPAVPSDPET
jgi:hypothetical protein